MSSRPRNRHDRSLPTEEQFLDAIAIAAREFYPELVAELQARMVRRAQEKMQAALRHPACITCGASVCGCDDGDAEFEGKAEERTSRVKDT